MDILLVAYAVGALIVGVAFWREMLPSAHVGNAVNGCGSLKLIAMLVPAMALWPITAWILISGRRP